MSFKSNFIIFLKKQYLYCFFINFYCFSNIQHFCLIFCLKMKFILKIIDNQRIFINEWKSYEIVIRALNFL